AMRVEQGRLLIALISPEQERWRIVNPSAFAAFRLMIRSNLVGCSTGGSAAWARLSIVATKIAPCREVAARSAPNDNRPPILDCLTKGRDDRQAVVRREPDDLLSAESCAPWRCSRPGVQRWRCDPPWSRRPT